MGDWETLISPKLHKNFSILMKNSLNKLQSKVNQHEVVANLGLLALEGCELKTLMDECCNKLVDVLDVEYSKVLQLVPGEECVILRAGKGWNPNVIVDESTVGIGMDSQAGYTLHSKEPVIVLNLKEETRFNGPQLLIDHNVVSGISVIIHGKEAPWGVLGIHTTKKRKFIEDEVLFLQSVANILAQTIQQKQITDERTNLMIQLDIEKTRFETVLQQMPSGVLVADAKSQKISYFNEEASKLLRHGIDADAFKYKKAYGALHEDGTFYKYEDYPIYKSLRHGEIVTQKTIKYKRGDGTITHLSVNAVPLYDYDNNISGSISTFYDIHDRIVAEKHKDEFLSIVSHELKTPVTSIKAYAQVLQRIFKQKNDVEAEMQMKKIDNQITRLAKLITDLLDATKMHSGKMLFNETEFNFNQLLEEIIDEVNLLSEQHTIICNTNSNCIIKGDRDRIAQVLINLLTNAIKYSPSADKVIITTECENNEIVVGIQDFGIGIDKDQQHKIFNRFYRVSEDNYNIYPGLGNGLYLTHQIVSNQGGKIWVQSKKGEGAKFFFTLPVKEFI